MESKEQFAKGRNSQYILALCGFLLLTIGGCGSGSNSSTGTGGQQVPDFSILLSSSAITIAQGTSQSLNIQISPINGFAGTVQIAASGLPSGVSAVAPSIAVSNGMAAGTIQFSATSATPVTSTTVSGQATSGSLKHSQPLTFGISPRSAAFPFTTLGGGILRGYYDAQRQLLFTSNFFLNEVDVVSTTDLSVSKRVSIPQPVGLDQMPDGKTIIAGTMTQGIYLINEDSFLVQANFVATPPPPNSAFNILPIIPASMANGKVLFIGLRQGVDPDYYLGGEIYEWDPTGNTFAPAPLSVGPTGPAETEHLARSGDRKFAVFNQYGGGVYVYSSDADSFVTTNNGDYSGDVAANSDGSQFAESINGWVNFYDRNLNLLGSVTPTPQAGAAELMAFYGMQYSPDGSLLYVQASDQYSSPLILMDTKQLKEVGMIPAFIDLANQPAYLLAADNSSNVYMAAEGGVGRVTCSNPLSSLPLYQLLPLTTEPDSAPLTTAAAATFYAFNMPPAGITATIGGNPAVLQSNTPGDLTVSVPASSVPGPADVVFSLPDGTVFVFPRTFLTVSRHQRFHPISHPIM